MSGPGTPDSRFSVEGRAGPGLTAMGMCRTQECFVGFVSELLLGKELSISYLCRDVPNHNLGTAD